MKAAPSPSWDPSSGGAALVPVVQATDLGQRDHLALTEDDHVVETLAAGPIRSVTRRRGLARGAASGRDGAFDGIIHALGDQSTPSVQSFPILKRLKLLTIC
jgi:hypothetical protein